MRIKVKEYYNKNSRDTDMLLSVIDRALEGNSFPIIVDFEGTRIFMPVSFNFLTNHLEFMSQEEYQSKIQIENLTENDMLAYKIAYGNAVSYYSLTPSQRKMRDEYVT